MDMPWRRLSQRMAPIRRGVDPYIRVSSVKLELVMFPPRHSRPSSGYVRCPHCGKRGDKKSMRCLRCHAIMPRFRRLFVIGTIVLGIVAVAIADWVVTSTATSRSVRSR